MQLEPEDGTADRPLDTLSVQVLRRRRQKIFAGGGTQKNMQRHARGLMTARERLLRLFQPDTFQEIGAHVCHSGSQFGMAERELPADGVVVGTGYVDGRQVCAVSQDFTVMGGTLGKMHARKMVLAMDYALKNGTPLVAVQDSGGARMQEGVDALSGYGEVFYRIVELSASCRKSRSSPDRAPAGRPTRRRSWTS